jgi:drug/metabolite transporter (DMT)-like permease
MPRPCSRTPRFAPPTLASKSFAGAALNPYVGALLLVTLVWGATFPVLKLATAQLSGVEVTALRFLIAAVCMVPFVWSVPRHTWRDGAVLGGLVLLSYALQAMGLEHISSNRSAFLTSLNVLMVPMLGLVFGVRPTWLMLATASLACAGIGLMSWEGGANLWADIATVAGALCYALYVILLSRRSRFHLARQLAAAQIVWMAALGAAWMVFNAWGTESFYTLQARMDGTTMAGLLYLGVVATAGMLFLQALAQRHVSADKAALVYAMEPVFAAMFAWAWLAEGLGVKAAIGGVLVVAAVIWSETGNTPPK